MSGRRRIAGCGLDENAPQPRSRLLIAHKALATLARCKPPAAGLLIELVQHAAPLCPGHPGLDLRDRMPGARQDRNMVGKRYAKRAGSRRVSPLCRLGFPRQSWPASRLTGNSG